jgi:competence protein ComEA
MARAPEPVERAARERLHRLAQWRVQVAPPQARAADSSALGWVPQAPIWVGDARPGDAADGQPPEGGSSDESPDSWIPDGEPPEPELPEGGPRGRELRGRWPRERERERSERDSPENRSPERAPLAAAEEPEAVAEELGDRLPDENDIRDVVARMRAGALGAAAASYTAAHGHPLEHPRPDVESGQRWHLSVRLAVVAGIAIALLAGGVIVRATLAAPTMPVATVPKPVGPSAPGATTIDPSGRPTASTGGAAPGSGTGTAGPVPAGTFAAGTSAGASGSTSGAGTVLVDVVGKVRRPGVIQLPAGSRVADAVAAAGGAAPGADLAAINLARVVADGEQIIVPAPGGPVAGTNGTGAAPAATKAPIVDLNTADLAALDALPGIGPVLAQRILDWRGEHVRFTDVTELGEVAGIGDKVLAKLRDLVKV